MPGTSFGDTSEPQCCLGSQGGGTSSLLYPSHFFGILWYMEVSIITSKRSKPNLDQNLGLAEPGLGDDSASPRAVLPTPGTRVLDSQAPEGGEDRFLWSKLQSPCRSVTAASLQQTNTLALKSPTRACSRRTQGFYLLSSHTQSSHFPFRVSTPRAQLEFLYQLERDT